MTLRIFSFLLIGLAAYYWWRHQAIKEVAYQACYKLCYDSDLELLDDAVYLKKQWLGKDKLNKWRWFRRFEFEFTSTREHRYKGWVLMVGTHIVDTHLDAFHIN